MIFRRRSREQPGDEPEQVVGERAENHEADDVEDDESVEAVATAAESRRRHGPWDAAEVRLEQPDESEQMARIDLGGLVVTGQPGMELQLQVDEATGQVVAAVLVTQDSALELRPFAAPRSGGIWDEVRREIAAEATRRGGTATAVDGEFGAELKVVVPVQDEHGRRSTQPSRVVGVDGPRWLLRGTFMGRAAIDPSPHGALEQAFKQVVVVRGDAAMAPRDPIPLRMPPDAVTGPPEPD